MSFLSSHNPCCVQVTNGLEERRDTLYAMIVKLCMKSCQKHEAWWATGGWPTVIDYRIGNIHVVEATWIRHHMSKNQKSSLAAFTQMVHTHTHTHIQLSNRMA